MNRLVFSAAILGASVASAQPKKQALPPATMPAIGDFLAVGGNPTWVKRDWLYDVPSTNDAAGKVVIHWFCGARVKACVDDLARLVTLKENAPRVYIVANIDGSKAQAKKLDPIRESEGVGRGTLAFGRGPTKIMKQMGITGPASIIVGVDGKVALTTTSSDPTALDARDAKATEMASAIKDYTALVSDAPKAAKPGDKFTLSLEVTLAPWMKPSMKTPTEFKLTAPPDFKCDTKELRGDQVKVDGQILTATVACTAPRGAYEARGELRFGYQDPTGAAGLGAESGAWKFEVKPR
ncbi:MAG: hypothetical protein SFX73_20430 [Kofleriaceae bacterium]|nr:hypothetical protein [Kofleriaceae bacterium]